MPVEKKENKKLIEKLEWLVFNRYKSIDALSIVLWCELHTVNDCIDSVNITDHNLMWELEWYDIDIYFLYDRYWQLYITEVWYNLM